MKLNKKKVLTASLAVSLVAILSFGTIAWFSDTDEVTNKFMVADSTQNPDKIFSVEVWEQVDQDKDGDYDAALFTNGYTYENILPGDSLGKKPWVRNTGAYDQYIRVKVTLDHAQEWKDMGVAISDLINVDTATWTRNDSETTTVGNKVTYVYYLNRILEPYDEGGKEAYLFTSVTIPDKLTQTDMAEFTQGLFAMDIVAEAVQTEHVCTVTGNVSVDAIAAFDTVMDNK